MTSFESVDELKEHWEADPDDYGPWSLVIEVDGIRSEACWGDAHVQPMLWPMPQSMSEPGELFRQRWDHPPSEAELDAWVRLGNAADAMITDVE